MNLHCAPCSDFYEFANGGWERANPIPSSRWRWSSFDESQKRTDEIIASLLAEARVRARAGDRSQFGKLGAFYDSCLTDLGKENGRSLLEKQLRAISAVSDRAALSSALRETKLVLPDTLFWADGNVDPHGSGRIVLDLQPGSLSLPERSFYVANTAEAAKARQHLVSSITDLFRLTGSTSRSAQEAAQRVLRLESLLAQASAAAADTRDPESSVNIMTVAAANNVTPHFDWAKYLQAIGAAPSAGLNMQQPAFFRAFDRALEEQPIADWQSLLQWELIRDAAPWLSAKTSAAAFRLDAALSGITAPKSKGDRCLAEVNSFFGEPLGQAYMARTFSKQARVRGMRMVDNLRAAMAERISSAKWLSPETRSAALTKLSQMRVYLGGPSKSRDYSSLTILPGAYLANRWRAASFLTHSYGEEIGHSVDASKWYKLPQDTGGGADQARNSFQYPAAAFQYPFFDPLADDALNYGAIGAAMGHELIHLFDDRGRKYDAHGMLRDWWKPADAARFAANAKLVQDQFAGYTVLGEHLNGALTLSENIADLGGLTIAYRALEMELKGQARRRIDGFTPEQRFFLGWARAFRGKYRPERLRSLLKTNVHAPLRLRVNGPLSNLQEFARAFGCQAGDTMVRAPSLRPQLW